MSFLRKISNLWPWGSKSSDFGTEPRRAASMDNLSASEVFEDRSLPSILYSSIAAPEGVHSAEVSQEFVGQGLSQYSLAERRYFRISIIVVDYLLEHEWFWLLTGQHRPPSQSRTRRRETQEWYVLSDARCSSNDDEHRTVCASEAQWSIAAPIVTTLLPGPSTTEKE